jgi:hypothetical protein
MKGQRRWWWQDQRKGWIIALLTLALSACQGGSIPDSMIDTWVTDHPEYQGCFLKITPARIIFGDLEGNSDDSYIKKVSTEKKAQVQAQEVTISYINKEEVSFSVVLLYSNEDGGWLSIKNQPGVVWKRQGSKN